MKKIIINLLIEILFFTLITGCTSNISEKPISTEKNKYEENYEYLSEVLEDRRQDYIKLNQKHKNKRVSYQITNADTEKILDTENINGIKIIEIYSPYCETCKKEAEFISKNLNNLENLTFILVSKEKNTKGVQIMRDSGYTMPIYYFTNEFPNEAYELYELGRPAYIVIDENNQIMFLTHGELNKDTYLKIFEPINELLPQNIIEEEPKNDSGICTSCE